MGKSRGTPLATPRQGGRGVGRAVGVSEGQVVNEAGTWGGILVSLDFKLHDHDDRAASSGNEKGAD
jgi:hypothetical protein